MSTLKPQATDNVRNYLGAVRSAEASTKTVLRGVKLSHQDGSLLSATATYRGTENVWHELAIAFLPHEDGGRRLTVQDDNPDALPSVPQKAAAKHLSEIVRSAIPVHREHVAAATELGQDPTEARHIIVRHLIDLAAGYLGYATSAAWKNRQIDPEKCRAPKGLLSSKP
jgi:hypothetical protein